MPGKRTKTDVTSRLRTIPLFSACTQRELNAVAAIMKEVKFDAGQVICQEGETGVGLHVVIEGETSVRVGGRTRRRLGSGAFFGEIALIDGGPRSASVVAETPVTTLSIPAWSFRAVLKAQPALALKMLEELCRRLRTADTSLSA
jgi:CRP/FNR family transcriptional regulator, cyclic AMP receptor protein